MKYSCNVYSLDDHSGAVEENIIEQNINFLNTFYRSLLAAFCRLSKWHFNGTFQAERVMLAGLFVILNNSKFHFTFDVCPKMNHSLLMLQHKSKCVSHRSQNQLERIKFRSEINICLNFNFPNEFRAVSMRTTKRRKCSPKCNEMINICLTLRHRNQPF